MLPTILVLLIHAALSSSTVLSTPAPPSPCIVAYVHDGDTLRCRDGRRIRLLLIDAPELDQPYGHAARRQLSALTPPGSRVTIELDHDVSDRYGRTLAYIYRGRTFVNAEIAAAGLAFGPILIGRNGRHATTIRTAVADAQRNRRGIWSAPVTCTPVDHRAHRC